MEDKTNSGSTVVEATENVPNTAKKPAKTKPKVQREASSHPPTSEMVNTAIKELKDRKGSSLQAIKKYISTTYKVDGEKFSPFIKRYLKSAVTSGAVVQTKGKGASGSFKLSTRKRSKVSSPKKVSHAAQKSAPKKAQSVEKKTVSKKIAPAKKSAAVKKAAPEKKSAPPKKSPVKALKSKSKPAMEAKSMSKTKKTAKAPAAKTKSPKPKKAATSSAKSAAKK